jgi:hypothetical protein
LLPVAGDGAVSRPIYCSSLKNYGASRKGRGVEQYR